MVLATNLGFPRMGVDRDLKKALESYWAGKSDADDLQKTAKELRARHWMLQKDAGIAHIPCNDFSFYDHVLDTACLVGCIPSRYGWTGGPTDLSLYFAMARGSNSAPAMEMTKWFDTNYHYIVPEFEAGQSFKLSSTKIFDEFAEAKAAGIAARPVLVGPLAFLTLGKIKEGGPDYDTLWNALLPVYEEIVAKLAAMGAEWIQIDEPFIGIDDWSMMKEGYQATYERLAKAAGQTKIMLTTYFQGLNESLDWAVQLPVAGLHLDLRRAPRQLDAVLAKLPADKVLSLGVVDGRNIWKNDLTDSLYHVDKAVQKLGKTRVFIAPSCSLLHTPVDLDRETALDPEVKGWLAFAKQKLDEVATLAEGAGQRRLVIAKALALSDRIAQERKISARIHDATVKQRLEAVTPQMLERQHPFAQRRVAQEKALNLPAWPTTTIGSFPQTAEIRHARAQFKRGEIDAAAYEQAMKKEIAHVVKWQEEAGLDVLVHGEAERNDMVEYFGEQLSGFAFTKNGWVQSYGSRCVKPPVIFGDVSRPKPMTVEWTKYAQSLTKKPMKGMLTGPITILCWSFVRDDQPRELTAKQIALAIRDEVTDLEKAGISVIQIDEPAIREGLPLRKSDHAAYLKWAVDAFKLSSVGVADATQVHTHMCYSEFNDIMESVAALDADVLSIETSRSQMELLGAFETHKYPNEVGPGVYDIHSPRVPTVEEMTDLLDKAARVVPPAQLWVNPDCGLKTRGWAEVEPALRNMVAAAKQMREKRQSAAA